MSKLNLVKKPGTDTIVSALIDGVPLKGFVSATQNLKQGCLSTTLVVNFDAVEVGEPAPEPIPVNTLGATFAPGSVTGTTKATIETVDGAGNYFAYKMSAADLPQHYVGDVVTDAIIYKSGADIPVDWPNATNIAIYELVSATDEVVACTIHKFSESDINVATEEPEEGTGEDQTEPEEGNGEDQTEPEEGNGEDQTEPEEGTEMNP